MTTKDLFRCIGNLSDCMIEEAAGIRRKKRWLPAARPLLPPWVRWQLLLRRV